MQDGLFPYQIPFKYRGQHNTSGNIPLYNISVHKLKLVTNRDETPKNMCYRSFDPEYCQEKWIETVYQPIKICKSFNQIKMEQGGI